MIDLMFRCRKCNAPISAVDILYEDCLCSNCRQGKEKKMKKIDRFIDDYFFLSNFYSAPVEYMGYTFDNTESAFQATKCPRRAKEFLCLDGSRAKKLGRTVPLREDWEQVKDRVMWDINLAKYTQNPSLKENLLATGDAYLEEGNTWGDRYWGTVNGVGENRLGKILMAVRAELKLWEESRY